LLFGKIYNILIIFEIMAKMAFCAAKSQNRPLCGFQAQQFYMLLSCQNQPRGKVHFCDGMGR
jgi:hypothetical protein